jgi:hypothetical protein
MTMRAVWNNVVLTESEDMRVVKEITTSARRGQVGAPGEVADPYSAPMEGHREVPQRHWCSR